MRLKVRLESICLVSRMDAKSNVENILLETYIVKAAICVESTCEVHQTMSVPCLG